MSTLKHARDHRFARARATTLRHLAREDAKLVQAKADQAAAWQDMKAIEDRIIHQAIDRMWDEQRAAVDREIHDTLKEIAQWKSDPETCRLRSLRSR